MVTISFSLSVSTTLILVDRTSLTIPIHQQSSRRTSTVWPALTCLNWEIRVEAGAAGLTLKMLSLVNVSCSFALSSSTRNCVGGRGKPEMSGGDGTKRERMLFASKRFALFNHAVRVEIGWNGAKWTKSASVETHIAVFNSNGSLFHR